MLIVIWSNTSGNATLYATVKNQESQQTFTEKLSLNSGDNTLSFDYVPESAGDYTADFFIVKDNLIIGPRTAYFSVYPVVTNSNSIISGNSILNSINSAGLSSLVVNDSINKSRNADTSKENH